MKSGNEKTLGRLSPSQFARTLKLFDELDQVEGLYALLGSKRRFMRLVESPRIQFSWSLAYELTSVEMTMLLIWAIGGQDAFLRLANASDVHEEALLLAEEEPEHPIGRIKASKALLALGLLMALLKSAECISTYSLTMNELVSRCRAGNVDAFLRAVTIDPSVLSAPSVAHQLSLAVMREDKKFMRRLKKALDGPHKGRGPYRKLRYSALVLEEAGALQAGNREHVFDVMVNKLKLYDQRHGDAFKGLFTQFSRWKKDAAT